jgi:glycosyltransferase involved in cell wall biosynthesis
VPAPFDPDDGIVGGAERYAFELARHMADRCPTTLVSFGRHDREERVGSLRVRVLGNSMFVRRQRSNPVALGLFGELARADVVHCHQQHVVASSLAAVYGRIRGKPVFVTDLGGGGWDISGYLSTDAWYRGHLHISEYSRSVFGHAGHPHAHVILGGVDTEKFSPDESCQRDGSVLFVGRLLPHKGLDDLIEGLPEGVRLSVIGRPLDAEYLSHLHALARGRDVIWRHDCDDEALVSAYRRASCVVLPSVYRTRAGIRTMVPELLGQTLIEGMACGTPVICTDVASMPEVVVHGATGLVVPANDPKALGEAIRQIVSNSDRAAAMGRAGRARVLEHFAWPAVVDRCLSIYRSGAPE